jgi:hypothetical protein
LNLHLVEAFSKEERHLHFFSNQSTKKSPSTGSKKNPQIFSEEIHPILKKRVRVNFLA